VNVASDERKRIAKRLREMAEVVDPHEVSRTSETLLKAALVILCEGDSW
jgi:uncharacterized ferredoxin-like protein